MNQPFPDNPIRLLLLDDQALLRASLARLLAAEPGFEVVGEYATPAEALELLNNTPADVVLVDIVTALDGGGSFISAAIRGGFQGRFLIVSESANAKNCALAIKIGASGIFLKSEAPERLILAIRVVASGGIWIDPQVIRKLADDSAARLPAAGGDGPRSTLTDREQRVLMGIMGGLTNKKIGQSLGLSESSVKTVVQQLFYRAGVRTRGQLVRIAMEGSLAAGEPMTV